MITYLIERSDSGVIDLIRSENAITALSKVVCNPRYADAKAHEVRITPKTVTATKYGIA